jgi:hypothetical protein
VRRQQAKAGSLDGWMQSFRDPFDRKHEAAMSAAQNAEKTDLILL